MKEVSTSKKPVFSEQQIHLGENYLKQSLEELKTSWKFVKSYRIGHGEKAKKTGKSILTFFPVQEGQYDQPFKTELQDIIIPSLRDTYAISIEDAENYFRLKSNQFLVHVAELAERQQQAVNYEAPHAGAVSVAPVESNDVLEFIQKKFYKSGFFCRVFLGDGGVISIEALEETLEEHVNVSKEFLTNAGISIESTDTGGYYVLPEDVFAHKAELENQSAFIPEFETFSKIWSIHGWELRTMLPGFFPTLPTSIAPVTGNSHLSSTTLKSESCANRLKNFFREHGIFAFSAKDLKQVFVPLTEESNKFLSYLFFETLMKKCKEGAGLTNPEFRSTSFSLLYKIEDASMKSRVFKSSDLHALTISGFVDVTLRRDPGVYYLEQSQKFKGFDSNHVNPVQGLPIMSGVPISLEKLLQKPFQECTNIHSVEEFVEFLSSEVGLSEEEDFFVEGNSVTFNSRIGEDFLQDLLVILLKKSLFFDSTKDRKFTVSERQTHGRTSSLLMPFYAYVNLLGLSYKKDFSRQGSKNEPVNIVFFNSKDRDSLRDTLKRIYGDHVKLTGDRSLFSKKPLFRCKKRDLTRFPMFLVLIQSRLSQL